MKDVHIAKYASPLKLFDYMARAKPIVASKLPCHLDVLNKENCKFYYPDDPKDLAKKVYYTYMKILAMHI